MNAVNKRIDPAVIVSAILCTLSVLSILFMSQLVAPPKVLFGRSLTAISPSLFPYLILTALATLNVLYLYHCKNRPDGFWSEPDFNDASRTKGYLFFAVMLFYALTMVPFGFFISSALSLAMTTILVGNRSLLQILLISVLPPVVLYLGATRLLAVALPELSPIEFFYAYVLGETAGNAGVVQ
ncbi:MAG: tripartite tricarboxylate transporter TctB family protein [Roseibium sp.]|uniref:tripartite tricarboxylate transporter TctB family protein n=1 Tax=Roseibium sp. TaxID=1936156 RepID=UPI002623099F|nr:tripartite tricarboxylate transporter TctB family protein [Roseibium sp.]MCV0429312.1 tripartite tricarboxylate transporter TctB family protein [Roseibium sp.]